MAGKDFKSALNRQRSATGETAGRGRLGVVGETPELIREELEKAAETLPVQELPLESLHDNPFQHLARPVLDEESLEELAASIRQNGFYGALLARRKRGTSQQYELAYGHRRREAARRAGLERLPVKVVELNDTQMARIMASENFSREDLTPLGEANVVGYLYTAQNMTVKEVAEVIGNKRGWVELRLALYNAPQELKDMVEKKPETLSHIRLLSPLKDPPLRSALVRQVLELDLTFEQLRVQIENIKTGTPYEPKVDNNFTISSNTENSETFHNASREKKQPEQEDFREGLLSREQSLRAEALRRLQKAAGKFESLIAQNEYQLTPQEKQWLAEIVESLSALLEQ